MKTPRKNVRAFLYCALPCEAKPLTDYFALKKDTAIRPFAVFRNDALCLVVTGPGKSAMAAGVAYSRAIFSETEFPVMLNVGIAGHKEHALGESFLIDKISDSETGKHYFPPVIFTPPCASAAIETASKPQLNYDHDALCDMEASAFYETAVRFTTGELCHCLKVVSDNASSPAGNITAQSAAELIAARSGIVAALLNQLTELAQSIDMADDGQYEMLIKRFRFSTSEQGQLKNRLSRRAALLAPAPADFDLSQFRQGKDVLLWLERQIEQYEFEL